MMGKRGLMFVLEGMVGCGKTTQVDLVKDNFNKKGINYVYGREPGGVPVAERIRKLLLDPENKSMKPLTEVYLFGAARAEYIADFVRPSLESGVHVLTDRSYLSTMAFQGYGKGVDLNLIKRYADDAVQGCHPDIAFILDVEHVEAAMLRARKESTKIGAPDRFEDEQISFHTRVRDGYRLIAMDDTKHRVLIPHYEGIQDIPTRIHKIYEVIGHSLDGILENVSCLR